MTDAKYYQATPHGTLLEQIMDPTQAKNEREWAASREIETLCQRVKDLECDVEKWKAIANQINTDWIPANKKLNDELAALKAGQGEPVAWIDDEGTINLKHNWLAKKGTKFYTSAPTIPESWVPVPMVAIDGCRDDILNGRGALEEVLDNDQTNAVLAVFDQYFDGAAPNEPPHA